MTPSGIDPPTIGFVAQCLNQLRRSHLFSDLLEILYQKSE
jgi:hypothetical protein